MSGASRAMASRAHRLNQLFYFFALHKRECFIFDNTNKQKGKAKKKDVPLSKNELKRLNTTIKMLERYSPFLIFCFNREPMGIYCYEFIMHYPQVSPTSSEYESTMVEETYLLKAVR